MYEASLIPPAAVAKRIGAVWSAGNGCLRLHRHQVLSWRTGILATASTVKSSVLYHFGSRRVFLITGAIRAYTFLSAILLQWFDVRRATTAGKQRRHFDIMSGSLPTPQAIGAKRRVLLGVPVNLRRGRAWQVFWT